MGGRRVHVSLYMKRPCESVRVRVLRNAVLIALAGYLPVALLATRIGSVRLLWSALAGFMVLRSGYQAYRFLRSDALDEPEP